MTDRKVVIMMTDAEWVSYDQLKRATGLVTDANVMNTAVSLLRWVVEQQGKGKIIAAVDEAANRYQPLAITWGLPKPPIKPPHER